FPGLSMNSGRGNGSSGNGRIGGGGSKFLGALHDGCVNLWNFDAQSNLTGPYKTLKTPFKHAYDACFVDSWLDIAAIGNSGDHKDVGIWDVLIPSAHQCVHLFQTSNLEPKRLA